MIVTIGLRRWLIGLEKGNSYYLCYMYAFDNKDLPHYTYDDFVQWEGRWELIYGIPYAMAPAPTQYHQSLNTKIVTELTNKLENCKNCKATIYVDWKIDNDTVLEPDALVICKPFEETPYITKAPSVIFEILSPSTAKKDRELKYRIYEKEGVKYYIIVHPLEKTVQIYLLENDKYTLMGSFSTEKYKFEMEGCQFEFDFGKIW